MDLDKICALIAKQLDIDVESIHADSRLIEDLKADSLDVVELVMDLEQEYGVQIPDEELPKIQTVGDILKYLGNK